MTNHEEILRRIFYDPATGFTGATKLHRQVKDQGITMREVRAFLGKQDIVQSTRKVDNQGSFIPQRKGQEIQIDLIYIDHSHLNQAKYAMTAIDIFTKEATAVLMKRKTEGEAVIAMKTVLSRLGVPEMVYSDRGSEFDNKKFQALLSTHNIKQVWTHTHAPFIERFNRTLKEMLFKYLASTGTKTITNVLPLLLKNYNSSTHSVTKMTPQEAGKKENEEEAFTNITKRAKIVKRPKLGEGDQVRTVITSTNMSKGFKHQFSKEVKKVESTDDGRVFRVLGHRHPFLRAHVRKVDEVQQNPNKGLLKGTAEGRLTQKGGLKAQQKVFHKKAEETQAQERRSTRSSRQAEQGDRATQALLNRLQRQGFG